MRLKAFLADDESAVSPVIGVILMVAITVILAAVIASFVLGLGPSDAAPTTNFANEVDSSGMDIEVSGGDTIIKSRISVSGTVNSNSFSTNWNGTTSNNGGDTVIQSGNSMTLDAISTSSTYSVDVVWSADDGSSTSTLATFES